MNYDDPWDRWLEEGFSTEVGSSMDRLVTAGDTRSPRYRPTSSDAYVPQPRSGTRVAYVESLEHDLFYDFPPSGYGYVVAVKTASGVRTAVNDGVFVLWDDGLMRWTPQEHVKAVFQRTRTASTANAFRRVVASMGDLSDFLKVSSSELVHKATKDLWSVSEEDGEFVIERLFDDTGQPLKGV